MANTVMETRISKGMHVGVSIGGIQSSACDRGTSALGIGQKRGQKGHLKNGSILACAGWNSADTITPLISSRSKRNFRSEKAMP